MIIFELFDPDHGFIFELSELLLPVTVEFLELLVSDLDVLSELLLLDVNSELILEHVDIGL